MNPVRTCVGCRQRANRSDLIRVIAQNNQLVIDHQKSLAGRGAWLHPGSNCFELAITRRAFSRALRSVQQFDLSGLIFTTEQAETMLAKNE
jgi:predicted RNA-binding protein YlxR (DUF448 family)